MAAIILSGGSYGANWLPLIFPLAAIIIIVKGVELLVHFIRKRKLQHNNESLAEAPENQI